MIAKIAVFFVIGMVVLGMFGKLKTPSLPKRKVKTAKKCKKCGTYLIGKQPCPCEKH